nr:immunoglobulin heavy chain junction region [Mus musculus]
CTRPYGNYGYWFFDVW